MKKLGMIFRENIITTNFHHNMSLKKWNRELLFWSRKVEEFGLTETVDKIYSKSLFGSFLLGTRRIFRSIFFFVDADFTLICDSPGNMRSWKSIFCWRLDVVDLKRCLKFASWFFRTWSSKKRCGLILSRSGPFGAPAMKWASSMSNPQDRRVFIAREPADAALKENFSLKFGEWKLPSRSNKISSNRALVLHLSEFLLHLSENPGELN